MSPTQDRARQAVTIAVFVAILIAAFWSIANIAEAAMHYHESPAASLIGIAFGLANAISVYVLATSRTSASRRPAIVGTIVFSVGSAAIQFHLYAEILNVATAPAFWFAALGPATEAILAWMEAGLHKENAGSKRNEQAAALEDEIATLAGQNAGQAEEIARLRAEARSHAAQLQAEAAAAEEARQVAHDATIRAQAAQQATAAEVQAENAEPTDGPRKLTATQQAKADQIVETIQRDPAQVWTAAEIADAAGWSKRTAQRHIKAAAEAQIVEWNGDGGLHTMDAG